MDEFLASLGPSVREQVDRALETPDGQRRLRMIVSPYIDDEGRWPRDVATNDYIARRFVRQMGVVAPVGMGVSYAGSGLRSTTISALAGGVTSVAAGKGAVVLQTRLLENYWTDMVAYSLGMQPELLRGLRNVVNRITDTSDWNFLGLRMSDGYDHSAWSGVTGNYAKDLTNAVLGSLARSAWRGMRSAILHTTGVRIGDVSDNEVIENYVRNFVEGQVVLSERTARLIATNAADKGLGPRITAERLKQMWALSPRHAQAVENYRAGLAREERPQGIINRMAGDYADKLTDHRLKAIANTETATAFNVAREAQWLKMMQTGDMPVGTLKMWVTAKDELVCPVCRPMDGVTAPIGQIFTEISLMVPTAHPNCRCIIIPVHDVPEFEKSKLIFPLEKVSKHLPGQHDQKNHGRRKTVATKVLFDFVGESQKSVDFTWKKTSQKFIDDIREHGIRNPIVMGFDPDSGKAMLLDGSHRMKVALKLGIDRLPVVIQERRLANDDRLKDAPAWVRMADRIFDEEFDRIVDDEWSPKDDEVSKHLIGRHDQKSHGRKGHSRLGGFEISGVGESLSSDEKTVLFATAGIASAALFRQAMPLASIKTIAKPAELLKRSGQYLEGMSNWVGGGSRNFRVFLEGQRHNPSNTRMWTAFADGLDQLAKRKTPLKLHRGMTVPATQAQRTSIKSYTLTGENLKVGHTFDMAPSSFTRSRFIAQDFTKMGSAKHGTQRVVMHVDRGSNTARIADVSPMIWEREYVGWGTYRINKVVQKKGYTDVYVTQTKTYSLGHLARNPPPQPVKPLPRPVSPKQQKPISNHLNWLEMDAFLKDLGKPSYIP